MADAKRKVIRINRVLSNGQKTAGEITLVLADPRTGEELRNDDGSPVATIRLQAMDEDERRAIVAAHTTMEKDPNGGRGLFEKTDAQAVNDEIYDRTILGWDGIAGADDRPLVCNASTKRALDSYIKSQVTRKLFGAEVVEVLAASFR
jgi:hypothetical protein